MKIYLASPFGFTVSGQEYMQKTMIPSLKKQKLTIFNPWSDLKNIQNIVKEIQKTKNQKVQLLKFKKLNENIAQKNVDMIDLSYMVLAILDGSDVDSGVAAEIGYAFSQKKKIFGLRTDFRQTGDNVGAIVNLQVEFFINKSGGKIFDNLDDLLKALKNYVH